MNLKNNKLHLISSFFLALFIVFLSFFENYWHNFWSFFSIPSINPPSFLDYKAIIFSLESFKNGYDPYEYNPYNFNEGLLMYPKIWLYYAEFFFLNNLVVYNLSILFFLTIYFNIFFKISLIINNYYFKFIIFIFFFSTTNALVIERMNVEIIIFILIFYSLTIKNNFLQIVYFSLAVVGKLFPIFSIFVFMDNKKKMIILLIISVFFFLIGYDNFLSFKKNFIDWSTVFAYGSKTLSRSFFNLSNELGFNIKDDDYSILAIIFILMSFISSSVIFYISYRTSIIKKDCSLRLIDRLFFAGALIYLGTFIIGSNVDYRLIFLVFLLPYLFLLENKKYKIIFFILLFTSINSWYFNVNNPYSINYFISGFIIHFIKINLMLIVSFELGKFIKQKNLLNSFLKYSN